MRECVTAALAVIAYMLSPGVLAPAWGQSPARRESALTAESGRTDSHIVAGRLERRDDRYALLNTDGSLQAYLIPRGSLDFDQYVGERVELKVREPILRTDGEPSLWVDRVTLASARPPQRTPPAPSVRRPRPLITQVGFDDHLFGDNSQEGELLGDYPPGDDLLGTPVAMSVADVTHAVGPPGWVWASAEYLLWRTDGMGVPALVTTSPAGTPRAQAGVLGQPNTTILLGEEDLLTSDVNGLRVRSGLWFDRDSRIGVHGDFFSLEGQSERFESKGNASGVPILARPFFNMNPRNPVTDAFVPPAREDAQLISFPGVMRGTIGVDVDSRLQSGSLALRTLLAGESFCRTGVTSYSRVDLLTGYRYLRLNDHLFIAEELNSLDPLSLASFEITDQFDTRNEFHGIDVGAVWQGAWQRFTFDVLMKTALGTVRQEVSILGGTVISQPNRMPQEFASGLLALPSNSGVYSRSRYAIVPELGAVIGFQVLPKVRATVGYTFVYWGQVVRAGDQIDLDVNPDQVPPPITPLAGPLRPEFNFQESDYWAQGVTVGVDARW